MVYTDLKFISLLSVHFEKFTRKGPELFNMRCPLCGDSRSKKNKMRGYIYRDKQKFAYKCWNCQASMWLGTLIKELNPTLYKEYLLETFADHRPVRQLTGSTVTVSQPMRFGMIEPVIYQTAEKISDLPEAHYCRQYVKSRQIPQKYWSKLYFTEHYNLFLDEIAPNHGKTLKDEPRLVIMFYDPFSAVCAVSGRALGDSDLRYITVRTTQDTSKLVYGMERVNQDKLVIVVEGPLDSLFLDNAVASGDANLILTAARLSAKQVVLVYDNEPRSQEINKQMERAVKAGHKVVVWPSWLTPKDLNAMILAGYSSSAIQSIIHTNTHSGLTALTHLTQWKKCETSNNRRILV